MSRNLLFGTMGPLMGIAIKGLNTSQHNMYVNCSMTTGGAGNTIDPKSEMSRNVFISRKKTRLPVSTLKLNGWVPGLITMSTGTKAAT
ncbi:hypothetical protein P4E94_03160 [Pontiellaceae bacterium B12219]|nr:hypothetical protein [Pontiellaceae bacterium B12219]